VSKKKGRKTRSTVARPRRRPRQERGGASATAGGGRGGGGGRRGRGRVGRHLAPPRASESSSGVTELSSLLPRQAPSNSSAAASNSAAAAALNSGAIWRRSGGALEGAVAPSRGRLGAAVWEREGVQELECAVAREPRPSNSLAAPRVRPARRRRRYLPRASRSRSPCASARP
jgi:hypothetical protein